MPERKRSEDGHRETEDVLGQKPEDLPDAPDQGGRAGGELQRKVGTRDEMKSHDDNSDGTTRPLAGDQDDSGDKENM